MTNREFCSLSRGDIIRAIGNGLGVVESAFYKGSEFTISLRLQHGDVVKDIKESEKELFESVKRLTSGSDFATIGLSATAIEEKRAAS